MLTASRGSRTHPSVKNNNSLPLLPPPPQSWGVREENPKKDMGKPIQLPKQVLWTLEILYSVAVRYQARIHCWDHEWTGSLHSSSPPSPDWWPWLVLLGTLLCLIEMEVSHQTTATDKPLLWDISQLISALQEALTHSLSNLFPSHSSHI